MAQFDLAASLSFIAQTIGAATVALILYSFYRQYGKDYLAHWTLGWTAVALYQVSTGLSNLLSRQFGVVASHPVRIVTAIVGGLTGYVQIGWLLFGVYELVLRRPVRLRESRRIITALALIGVALSLLFISPDTLSSGRYATRVGLRAVVAFVAFGVASLKLWQAKRRHHGVGFSVLSIAFGLYALEQLQYTAIAGRWLITGTFAPYTFYLGFADFLLQSIIAIGMIACLLEDEREATQLASNEIEHLAYHDALTGLPNRPLFMDRLIVAIAQANRGTSRLAVLFLDLDRFKEINDSLGHTVGDQVLKSVAERIRRCIRDGDTIARFGGDEFVLLIPRVDHVEDAAKIAQKVLETVKIPSFVGDREMVITASIGVSIYPTDGVDGETLVRNADTAMYRAKDVGRDNCQLYAPAMNAQALERLALENMLRKALAQNELVLHYQPQFETRTNAIVGFEALIRWMHPELGLLPPGQFIGPAEASGLILPIGEWVLRTACRQLRTWEKRVDHPITVAVNLSARQFQQPNLVEQVRRIVEETGIRPSSLELEITESNAMQNAENTIYTLRELKALGIRISMDDFGTGYSSLNYLKRFPIDTLKLDQSFVRDVCTTGSDAAIVSAVITMAHSLNLQVVAEGVETTEQLEFLKGQNCDKIQGFLFSRPLAVDAIDAFLAQRKTAFR